MLEFALRYLARILTGILSVIQASNLRNELYSFKNEHELMWTALDDIARMHKGTQVGSFATKTLERVTRKYGK